MWRPLPQRYNTLLELQPEKTIKKRSFECKSDWSHQNHNKMPNFDQQPQHSQDQNHDIKISGDQNDSSDHCCCCIIS